MRHVRQKTASQENTGSCHRHKVLGARGVWQVKTSPLQMKSTSLYPVLPKTKKEVENLLGFFEYWKRHTQFRGAALFTE